MTATESRAQPEDGALADPYRSYWCGEGKDDKPFSDHSSCKDTDCQCKCHLLGDQALVADLSAERTMLGLEAQAERELRAWHTFDGDVLRVHHSREGFRYIFYTGSHAGDVVRRSTAVRLLALAKKGQYEAGR